MLHHLLALVPEMKPNLSLLVPSCWSFCPRLPACWVSAGGGGISSDGSYALVSADLRHTDRLHSALEAAGADFSQE